VTASFKRSQCQPDEEGHLYCSPSPVLTKNHDLAKVLTMENGSCAWAWLVLLSTTLFTSRKACQLTAFTRPLGLRPKGQVFPQRDKHIILNEVKLGETLALTSHRDLCFTYVPYLSCGARRLIAATLYSIGQDGRASQSRVCRLAKLGIQR
jgi:hypothetical protein